MNHTKGKKVAYREILNWLQKKHAVYCIKYTLFDIGLSYKPIKPKVHNNDVACLNQIRDYMIYLHALINLEKEVKAFLIYLDESYCNTTHSNMHVWHIFTGNAI